MSLALPQDVFEWLVDYGTLSADSATSSHDSSTLVDSQYSRHFLNGLLLGRQLHTLNQVFSFASHISFASLTDLTSEHARNANWELIADVLLQLFHLELTKETFSQIMQGDISLIIKIIEEVRLVSNKLIIKVINYKHAGNQHVLPPRQKQKLFPPKAIVPVVNDCLDIVLPTGVDFEPVSKDFIHPFHSHLLDSLISLSTPSKRPTTPTVHQTVLDFVASALATSFEISIKRAGSLLIGQLSTLSAIFSLGEGTISESNTSLKDFNFNRWSRVRNFVGILFHRIDSLINLLVKSNGQELSFLLSLLSPILLAPNYAALLPFPLSTTSLQYAGRVAMETCGLISEIIRMLLLNVPESLDLFFSWLLFPCVSMISSTNCALIPGDFTTEPGLSVLLASFLSLFEIQGVDKQLEQTISNLFDSILSLDFDRFLNPSSKHSIRFLLVCSTSFLEFLLLFLPILIKGQNHSAFLLSTAPLTLFDYARDRVISSSYTPSTRCSALKLLVFLWTETPQAIPATLAVVISDVIQSVLFSNFNELNHELLSCTFQMVFKLLEFSLSSKSNINGSSVLGPFFFSTMVQALVQYWDVVTFRSTILIGLSSVLYRTPAAPSNLIVKAILQASQSNSVTIIEEVQLLYQVFLFGRELPVELINSFLNYLGKIILNPSCSAFVIVLSIAVYAEIIGKYLSDDVIKGNAFNILNQIFDKWKTEVNVIEPLLSSDLIFRLFSLNDVSISSKISSLIEEFSRNRKKFERTRLRGSNALSETELSKLSTFLTSFIKKPSAFSIEKIGEQILISKPTDDVIIPFLIARIKLAKNDGDFPDCFLDDDVSEPETEATDSLSFPLPLMPKLTDQGPTFLDSIIFDREILLNWLVKKPVASKQIEQPTDNSILKKLRPSTSVFREKRKWFRERQLKALETVKLKLQQEIEHEKKQKEEEKERDEQIKRALARIRRKRLAETTQKGRKSRREGHEMMIEEQEIKQKESMKKFKELRDKYDSINRLDQFEEFEINSNEFYIYFETTQDIDTFSRPKTPTEGQKAELALLTSKYSRGEYCELPDSTYTVAPAHNDLVPESQRLVKSILIDVLAPLGNEVLFALRPLVPSLKPIKTTRKVSRIIKKKVSKLGYDSEPLNISIARRDRLRRLEMFLLKNNDFDFESGQPTLPLGPTLTIDNLDPSKVSDQSLLRMKLAMRTNEMSRLVQEQRSARRHEKGLNAYAQHRNKLEKTKEAELINAEKQRQDEMSRLIARNEVAKKKLSEASSVYSFINEMRLMDEYSAKYEDFYYKTAANVREKRQREREKALIQQRKEQQSQENELKMMKFHDDYSRNVVKAQKKLAQKVRKRQEKLRKQEIAAKERQDLMKQELEELKAKQKQAVKQIQPILEQRAQKALEWAKKRQEFTLSQQQTLDVVSRKRRTLRKLPKVDQTNSTKEAQDSEILDENLNSSQDFSTENISPNNNEQQPE
ncbi:hypothetical protein RCL1_002644 [Eukaryota sp. TZLM3-RCL]